MKSILTTMISSVNRLFCPALLGIVTEPLFSYCLQRVSYNKSTFERCLKLNSASTRIRKRTCCSSHSTSYALPCIPGPKDHYGLMAQALAATHWHIGYQVIDHSAYRCPLRGLFWDDHCCSRRESVVVLLLYNVG